MIADTKIFFESDDYRVVDFRCRCDLCSVSAPEYNDSFCVSFVRSGFFEYRTFRQVSELHTGRFLLSKPGYEHRTRHIDRQPDITAVFEFTPAFFNRWRDLHPQARFLWDPDRHALMLTCLPSIEYAYQQIWQRVISGSKPDPLDLDERIYALLEKIAGMMQVDRVIPSVSAAVRKHHLQTMETAREYLNRHFREETTIEVLARHCAVSPFHFSRIFRSVYQCSPYQYLRALRLEHSHRLLAGTKLPVAHIAFDSGFQNVEHFSTAYRQHFGESPSRSRRRSVVRPS